MKVGIIASLAVALCFESLASGPCNRSLEDQYAARYTRGEVVPSPETMMASAQARRSLRPGVLARYAAGRGPEAPFAAEEFPPADTIRVYSRSGKFQPDTQVRVLILPGMGWNRSDHSLIRDMIRVAAEPGVVLPGSGFSYPLQTRVAFEVMEMPGHGVGRIAAGMEFPTLDTVQDIIQVLQQMRRETPGLPIVVLGWSGGAFFPTHLANLVDGLVLVAPSPSGYTRETLGVELSKFWPIARTIPGYHLPIGRVTGGMTPNFEGRDYFLRLSQEARPRVASDFTVPSLAFFATSDVGVPAYLQKELLAAQQGSQLRVVPFEGYSHEPFVNFGLAHDFQTRAWQELDAFLAGVVARGSAR